MAVIWITKMADTACRPDMSSPYAPPSPITNVTFPGYRNVYVYSAAELWLAYGLAVLSIVLSVIAGFYAIHNNQAAYSNKVSTVLRARATAQISELIGDNGTGRDPLPERLAKAKVVLGSATLS